MLRLFNIGNTHTQTALLSPDGSLSHPEIFNTVDLDPARWPDEAFAVASVVPRKTELFRSCGAFVLERSSASDMVDLEPMEHPETVGADRLANLIALTVLHSFPAVSIDCGTAITFEMLDAEKKMRGGAIIPGRAMLRRALHEFTAQLPLIPMTESQEQLPGNSTRRAMLAGTDTGAVGSVREILSVLQKKYPVLKVVFCGGDSPFFLPYFPDAVYGGPLFTLTGLAAAVQHWMQKKAVPEKERL